ncbi:tetratricopeptide repeat protein, partial [Herpetosiphon giganteus]|uniref:tetratricopeptide repeat protein n=1 Tax=Herpetosiphon giganteus TaxID=2029754 RepID=UPI00195BB0D4
MVLLDDAFESTVAPALTSYIWLLRWCDSAQLASLTPYSSEQIERFCQSTFMLKHHDHGWYELHEAPALNDLPYREHEVFAAAFEYSQQQLNRLVAEAWNFELQRWLYYLESYLELLSARREWPTIAKVLEQATSIPQVNPRQQQILQLYQAIIQMRLERQYALAQSVLQQLRDDIHLEADLLPMVINSLGTLAWFRGAYDQAIQHYIEQLQHAQQVQNWLYQGHSLLNQSILANHLQRPEQALELSLHALEALQRAGNRYREAHALYEVGSNLLYLCRWDEADSYFSRSAALYETLDTVGDLANLYWHIGFLKHLAGDLAASEQAYQISIDAARASVVPNDDSLRDSLAFLGLLYCSMHDYQAALAIYAQAEALARQQNNRHELALILNHRGDAERRSGAIDAAFAAFAESIAIIEDLRTSFRDEDTKLGLISTAQQVYEHMVVLCIERGDAAQAVDYIERARSRAFLDALQAGDASSAAELSQQCANLAEIQAKLDQRTAIVEYFTVGVLGRSLRFLAALAERKSPILHHFSLEPALYSVAITATNATIQQHSFNPLNLTRGHGGHHRLLQPRILKAISQALIEPYEALLSTLDLVYVVPHGPLETQQRHSMPMSVVWMAHTKRTCVGLGSHATV